MKTNILHSALIIFALATTSQIQAQVTIDQSNFLRGTTYIDTLIEASPSTLGAPSEGADQVWDYSALTAGELVEKEHVAVNEPAFPAATSRYRSDLTFQGLPIESYTYEGVDANGWYVTGNQSIDVSFSITALTGGPNDTLRFPGGNYPTDVLSELINFPATYLDEWTNTVIDNTPFELTIAAFGLDKTPGYRKRAITTVREIAGYGELTMPDLDGNPSAPMDVLLMKTTSIAVDSVFLGGSPAPQALMDAFGLVQGSTVTSTSYLFYKPGFGSAVLFYDPSDDEFSYRPQAAELVSGVKHLDLAEVKHFPNPIATGQTLTIETDRQIAAGYFKMTDVQGRLVHESAFEAEYGSSLQFEMPGHLNHGMYFYQIHEPTGKLVGVGKLRLN